MLAHAGWDEARALAEKVHASRKRTSQEHDGGKPIYGMRGHRARPAGG